VVESQPETLQTSIQRGAWRSDWPSDPQALSKEPNCSGQRGTRGEREGACGGSAASCDSIPIKVRIDELRDELQNVVEGYEKEIIN